MIRVYDSRLPIVQGGDFGFLAPTFAILSLPQWTCPKPEGQFHWFLWANCRRFYITASESQPPVFTGMFAPWHLLPLEVFVISLGQ